MKHILIGLIKIYQKIPFRSHFYCKFIPTCSNYAIEAIDKHGVIVGILLGIWRILRCNPFSRGGYDPVPDKVCNCRKHKKIKY
jgi:putative membrane protein insertion efficiency factor